MANFLENISFSDDLVEGIDFITTSQGYRIMTAKYLTDRGWCCGNGCLNCPYHPRATKGNTNLKNK